MLILVFFFFFYFQKLHEKWIFIWRGLYTEVNFVVLVSNRFLEKQVFIGRGQNRELEGLYRGGSSEQRSDFMKRQWILSIMTFKFKMARKMGLYTEVNLAFSKRNRF